MSRTTQCEITNTQGMSRTTRFEITNNQDVFRSTPGETATRAVLHLPLAAVFPCDAGPGHQEPDHHEAQHRVPPLYPCRLSFCLAVRLAVRTVSFSVRLAAPTSHCLTDLLFVCLPVLLPVWPYHWLGGLDVKLPICLSVCPPICLSVCPSICPSGIVWPTWLSGWVTGTVSVCLYLAGCRAL